MDGRVSDGSFLPRPGHSYRDSPVGTERGSRSFAPWSRHGSTRVCSALHFQRQAYRVYCIFTSRSHPDRWPHRLFDSARFAVVALERSLDPIDPLTFLNPSDSPGRVRASSSFVAVFSASSWSSCATPPRVQPGCTPRDPPRRWRIATATPVDPQRRPVASIAVRFPPAFSGRRDAARVAIPRDDVLRVSAELHPLGVEFAVALDGDLAPFPARQRGGQATFPSAVQSTPSLVTTTLRVDNAARVIVKLQRLARVGSQGAPSSPPATSRRRRPSACISATSRRPGRRRSRGRLDEFFAR